MAVPQFKAVLIATPQMRSESGLTFRSKQSAVWPADPRGRRGCREPAGKTCYLPRFHIMKKVLYNRDLTMKHTNFTRADVKQELDIAGIDPREYSLNGIDSADQYVLDTCDGRWTVSFSERGSRREIAEFDRETDAALHLLNRVLVSKERQNRSCPKTKK